MAVTHQPDFYQQQPKSDFQTSLCSCSEDKSVCCLGAICLPCLGCLIASDMDECCMFGICMAIRSVYRTKYNIRIVVADTTLIIADGMRSGSFSGKLTDSDTLLQITANEPGSLCDDCLMTCCCLPCATCQLKRDIDRRKAKGTFSTNVLMVSEKL